MSARPPSAEDEFVARLIRPLSGEGAFNLMDDAARVTAPREHELVLTADAIVVGVHALPEDPPDLIARKALRMNLSDIAAKGAKPLGFLMTLAVPKTTDQAWLTRFFEGLKADCESFACPLLGGDTTRTPGPLSVSITLIGAARPGRMPTRLDARSGDVIGVTGTIGDAALGLIQRRAPERAAGWNLSVAEREHLASRYLLPQPRIELAEIIARHARAAMDVSDGLVGDLERLCRASGLSAQLDADEVPLSPAARKALVADHASIESILGGGDDYEILLTLERESWSSFSAECEVKGIAATLIGETVSGEPGTVRVMQADRELVLEQTAFSHL
ncbi:MAG: thiamine-phosphate kinase [Hyphomicrobiales bacterium]|nr:thiamine-phosphate kinase [Hyphomicrobiales bacterium]MBV9588788.1 thiamine-phosphate kinase [Hyphomicrobiales bacterium]MBV9977827.1 thiamine-phosphate kinase [Hyphomicrobiales bacterium]